MKIHLRLQSTTAASSVIFSGMAVIFRMSLQPNDSIGASGDRLEVMLQGIIISCFY